MNDCLFCKIVKGEIPPKKVYEDEGILAFYDVNPRAPVHVLFIPKEHFESLREVREEHENLLGSMLLKIAETARNLKIDKSGYKVLISTGKEAGQEIFHLHMHLMGGWKK